MSFHCSSSSSMRITHTDTHRLDEQWYWYGSGFPPCSIINHLKGSLLSGPFLLFLHQPLPPLLPHSGPFGPKDSNDSETTARKKKKRCFIALWHCTEPAERRFSCGRTFSVNTLAFLQSLKDLMMLFVWKYV